MNFYLMTHDHPPLIVFNEDKRLYYECLEKYDAAEELDPLHAFFRYELEKTWEKVLGLDEGGQKARKGLTDFT